MNNLLDKIYEHPFISILLIDGVAYGVSKVIDSLTILIRGGEIHRDGFSIELSKNNKETNT